MQLGNLISNFVQFPTRVMTNKNEEHVVHSLIYVGQKKEQRRRSFIPKSMCELDFSLFSFSTGVLINIQLRCVLNITYIFSKEVKWCVKEFVFWFVALKIFSDLKYMPSFVSFNTQGAFYILPSKRVFMTTASSFNFYNANRM